MLSHKSVNSGNFIIPKGNFIDLWMVNLNTQECSEFEASSRVLDKQESERAKRFKFQKDRSSFLKRRIALRHILAKYLGTEAGKLVIHRDKQTKPYLTDYNIEFNTSVSEEYALVVISSAPIGIDIEYHKDLDELLPLAKSVFSEPELALLKSQQNWADAQHTFYQIWCLKEAYLKAIGLGLSIDPRQISFDLPTQTMLSSPPQKPYFKWQFQLQTILPDYSIAIATPFTDMNLRLFNY